MSGNPIGVPMAKEKTLEELEAELKALEEQERLLKEGKIPEVEKKEKKEKKPIKLPAVKLPKFGKKPEEVAPEAVPAPPEKPVEKKIDLEAGITAGGWEWRKSKREWILSPVKEVKEEAPAEKKEKKRKLWIIPVIILLLLVGAAAFLWYSGYLEKFMISPEEKAWQDWANKYGIAPEDKNKDMDGDGISNYDEHIKGTDPTKKDTDGDGLPDSTDPKPTVKDNPPVAKFIVNSPVWIEEEEIPEVVFDASESSDADGDKLLYIWDFGDGQKLETDKAIVSRTYSTAGGYNVTLTVWDGPADPNKALSASTTAKVAVNERIILTGSLSAIDNAVSQAIDIFAGATKIYVKLEFDTTNPLSNLNLTLKAPDGTETTATGRASPKEIAVDLPGEGTWTATVDPDPLAAMGLNVNVSYTLTMEAYYDS